MLKQRKLNRWPQDDRCNAQYILRSPPDLISPFAHSSSPFEPPCRVHPPCLTIPHRRILILRVRCATGLVTTVRLVVLVKALEFRLEISESDILRDIF